MSETRDLGAPLLVLLAGIGVLVWGLSAGDVWQAISAGAVGFVGAGLALRLALRKEGLRTTFAAVGALLLIASLAPPFAPARIQFLPWALAAFAVAFHLRLLPTTARRVLLGAAVGLVVFAAVAALSHRAGGPTAAAFAVAGALACAANVLTTKPIPVAAIPVGPVVGVFGGSFDPFHVGHRAICEAAVEVVQRLLVVVAARPPHKQGAAAGAPQRRPSPFHHRAAMSRLGVEGLPRTEVVELENRRDGPSYTVETLDVLRRLYPPGSKFRLIIGADSFQDFPMWHDWEGILDRADLLVAARPGHELEPPPEFEGRNAPFTRLECKTDDVSSTEIRRRVRAGESLGSLVTPAVATYIGDHALYKTDEPVLDPLDTDEFAAPKARPAPEKNPRHP